MSEPLVSAAGGQGVCRIDAEVPDGWHSSDERGFLVTRSNPARVLAAIGLGLQIPYLVWYVLGLRTDVWRIHVDFGVVKTNPDGYWDIPFFDLLSTLLLVLCVVLAAISLLVGSRAMQRALVGGAVAAFVLSIAGYLVHVSRFYTDYGVPSFPFTGPLKRVLGFGDYTYPLSHPASFPHVYWGGSPIWLLAARYPAPSSSWPRSSSPWWDGGNSRSTSEAPGYCHDMREGRHPETVNAGHQAVQTVAPRPLN